MNDAVIIAVANAVTANAEVLKSLIDALPKEAKAAVEKRVTKATASAAPVASVEATVAPVVEPAPAPVVQTTTAPVAVPTTPAMPAPPFPTAAVQAPANPAPIPAAPVMATLAPVASAPVAPAAASPSNVPFSDHKGLLKWVMDSYQAMPKEKGAMIQNVLNGLGAHNINDVKPEQYAALYAGVEALKAS